MLKIPTLILPLPPTDNRRLMPYIIGRGPRLLPTSEFNAWKVKANMVWQAYKLQCYKDGIQLELVEPSLSMQYIYKYKLFKKDDRTDDQNFEKALKDFLEGRVYKDDRHVRLELVGLVEIDKVNPRIEFDLVPHILSMKKQIEVN